MSEHDVFLIGRRGVAITILSDRAVTEEEKQQAHESAEKFGEMWMSGTPLLSVEVDLRGKS